MLDFQASRWLIAGEVAGQAGNDHPTGIPTGVFPTADGHINIAASGEHLWKRFCEAIGAPELLDHPEYATRRAALEEPQGAERAHRRDHPDQDQRPLDRALNEAGVPCGPINTIDQTFAEPQVQHLGIATRGPSSQARRHQGGRPADQPEPLAAAQGTQPTPDSASTPTRCCRAWASTKKPSKACTRAASSEPEGTPCRHITRRRR